MPLQPISGYYNNRNKVRVVKVVVVVKDVNRRVIYALGAELSSLMLPQKRHDQKS